MLGASIFIIGLHLIVLDVVTSCDLSVRDLLHSSPVPAVMLWVWLNDDPKYSLYCFKDFFVAFSSL